MENDRLLDDVITTEGSMEIQSAGLGIRFANFFIDGIIIRVLNTILTYIVATIDPFLAIGISVVMYFVYYIGLEATTGQTVGKMITGTVVVDEHGQKIDGGKATIRTLCRLIVLIDQLSFFFMGGNRGLHDTLSKTYVIKKPSY
jgi:uncharacterized RDD family membrane protein YckC